MENSTDLTTAVVASLPGCDYCGDATEAHYDGATKAGPWAYMCDKHFTRWGVGLGTGRGQRLIVG